MRKLLQWGIRSTSLYFVKKEFHNPYILSKLADFHKIDQTGTNYPRSIYSPFEISRSDSYEEIARLQKIDEDRRAEEKKKRDFPRPATPGPGSAIRPQTPQINQLNSTSSLPARPPTPGNSLISPGLLDGGLTDAQIAAAKSKAKAAAAAAAIDQEFSKKVKDKHEPNEK